MAFELQRRALRLTRNAMQYLALQMIAARDLTPLQTTLGSINVILRLIYIHSSPIRLFTPTFFRRLTWLVPRLTALPPFCRKLPSITTPSSPATRPTLPALLPIESPVVDADVGLAEAGPGPPIAQPTSTPHLMLHSHARTNTGVLTSTFRTGYISGYRDGGLKKNSRT